MSLRALLSSRAFAESATDPPAEPRRPRRARRARYALVAVLLALLPAFVWVDRGIVRRFEKRTTSLPSRVHARPFTLARGTAVDGAALRTQLEHLAYQEVRGEPTGPGQFQRDGNDWVIFLRAAVTPKGQREAYPVKLSVWWKRLHRITNAASGERLESFALEAEPLITFYDDVMEERRWTPLGEIPPDLRQAVVVVEDRRFERHHGLDLLGIARAIGADIRAGALVQGGSTITQQLAKNLYGPGKRTFKRKALEAAAALALELHYDKDTILEAYLNEVYLGQQGPVAVSGLGEASRFFFGAEVGELDLPQSALLAGMIRNPGGYNPRRHPAEARERRDLVLRMLREQGVIDEPQLTAALAAPLGVRASSTVSGGRSPWIEDYLADAITPLSPEAVPASSGHSIFTTFDASIQRAAQEALTRGLEQLEERRRRRPEAGEPLEGAVVVLRPVDGAVLALVGGRDYGRSQYNRATQAHRSPGSTFKPFVYLAGLERARRDRDFEFTASTVLDDSPFEIVAGGKPWSPSNYDKEYRGPVTVRDALEQSINVPTARAALDIGLPRIVDVAHRCGIESPLHAIPSLALGSEEVTPLELAAAYAPFANGGFRVHPHGLLGVVDRSGVPTEVVEERPQRVIDAELAYTMTDLLEGVLTRGTAHAAADLGFSGTAAGKTGTSDSLRDAWFVGYTPEILVAVWVGYDDNRPVGLSGAAAALPIWVDIMRHVGGRASGSFTRPRGVVTAWIDPTTGLRATRHCPESREEIFVRGTEPTERCTMHDESSEDSFGLFRGGHEPPR